MARFIDQKHMSITEAFERFHNHNPDVWIEFERMMLGYATGTQGGLSAKLVLNRLRWEIFNGQVCRSVKIHDAFSPHYGRMFATNHPEYSTRVRLSSLRGQQDKKAEFPDADKITEGIGPEDW